MHRGKRPLPLALAQKRNVFKVLGELSFVQLPSHIAITYWLLSFIEVTGLLTSVALCKLLGQLGFDHAAK